MLEHRIEALDEGARLQDLCFDAARARLQQLNEEDMLGLHVRRLPPDVDAETLIGRVPDRVWTFSIHRRPRRLLQRGSTIRAWHAPRRDLHAEARVQRVPVGP